MGISRKGSRNPGGDELEQSGLLNPTTNLTDSDLGSDIDTSDLPPPARRPPRRKQSPVLTPGGTSEEEDAVFSYPTSGHRNTGPVTASAAFKQLFTSHDPQALFRQLDEDFIKPTLLLDGPHPPGPGGGGGVHHGAGGANDNHGEGPSV